MITFDILGNSHIMPEVYKTKNTVNLYIHIYIYALNTYAYIYTHTRIYLNNIIKF